MPNRILRDWTCSEIIDKLSTDAEVFFTRLIMKADDFGCFHANPKLIKSALFPLRDIKDEKVSNLINELVHAEIIVHYEVKGKKYLKINDFGQRLRTMKSKYPQPDDNSLTVDSHVSVNCLLETETETETEEEVEKNNQEIIFPFLSDNFKTAWDGWKEYRKKEKRKKYNDPKTEQTALNGLARKANNDESTAISIILHSIENTWTGLFAIDEKKSDASAKQHEHLQSLKDRLS